MHGLLIAIIVAAAIGVLLLLLVLLLASTTSSHLVPLSVMSMLTADNFLLLPRHCTTCQHRSGCWSLTAFLFITTVAIHRSKKQHLRVFWNSNWEWKEAGPSITNRIRSEDPTRIPEMYRLFCFVTICTGLISCDEDVYNTTAAATNIESTLGTPVILVDPTSITTQNSTDTTFEVSITNKFEVTVTFEYFSQLLELGENFSSHCNFSNSRYWG